MKDKILNNILQDGNNIAQYISFSPTQKSPHYINIKSKRTNYANNKDIISDLIANSNSKSINIRSFSPEQMKGNKLIFDKKLDDLEEILGIIEENQNRGFYSILNENIDISDGGVSGVILNGIMEFSPNDTPKCVEKPDVCVVNKEFGNYLFNTIYGFTLDLTYSDNYRVEFSIHPKKQGVLNSHTILWEAEQFGVRSLPKFQNYIWPNRFSQFIGDKAFGLLLADFLGFNVPYTILIGRNVAPFTFGKITGQQEKWIRTCPVDKVPGKYYSANTWIDPFELMSHEDDTSNQNYNIASILSQNAVNAIYSGASIVTENKNKDVIEGVEREGDLFMLGKQAPIDLPNDIISSIQRIHEQIRLHIRALGSVSIEWVYDGEKVWIVQMNQIKQASYSNIIVEGSPSSYIQFPISNGLEELRNLIKNNTFIDKGIELIGNVGLTSHFGDLLRQASIPSRIISNVE